MFNKVKLQLEQLAQPGSLALRLRELDGDKPLKRIFVMGCGRSGTWLLTALMTTFADTMVISRELPVENFGLLRTDLSTLVLKRDWESYMRIERIPDSIGIAYIVRHPFDVLTSHNPMSDRAYHIEPHRWLGEMLALQYLIDTQRPNARLVRYEDLVAEPEAVQAGLGEVFGLEIAAPATALSETFRPSPEATAAMHGVRPIDRNSVGRYKTRPEHIDYLRGVRPRLGRTLDWVGEAFGYDIGL